MSNLYQYSKKNNFNFFLKNSLYFYLLNKDVRKNIQLYKINNQVKIFYFDSLIKNYIYITINGLKKSSFFNKNQYVKIKNENNTFVSYNYNFTDEYNRFKIYPKYYNYNVIKSFFDKRSLITNYYNKWNLRNTENLLIPVKTYYKRFVYLDNKGSVNYIMKEFFDKSIFTGLIRLLPSKTKNSFKKILILYYLLINYNSLELLLKKKKKPIYQLYLYYSLYFYYFKNFITTWNLKKINIRKNNTFLYKMKYILFNNYIVLKRIYKLMLINFNLIKQKKSLSSNTLDNDILLNKFYLLYKKLIMNKEFNEKNIIIQEFLLNYYLTFNKLMKQFNLNNKEIVFNSIENFILKKQFRNTKKLYNFYIFQQKYLNNNNFFLWKSSLKPIYRLITYKSLKNNIETYNNNNKIN